MVKFGGCILHIYLSVASLSASLLKAPPAATPAQSSPTTNATTTSSRGSSIAMSTLNSRHQFCSGSSLLEYSPRHVQTDYF